MAPITNTPTIIRTLRRFARWLLSSGRAVALELLVEGVVILAGLRLRLHLGWLLLSTSGLRPCLGSVGRLRTAQPWSMPTMSRTA